MALVEFKVQGASGAWVNGTKLKPWEELTALVKGSMQNPSMVWPPTTRRLMPAATTPLKPVEREIWAGSPKRTPKSFTTTAGVEGAIREVRMAAARDRARDERATIVISY